MVHTKNACVLLAPANTYLSAFNYANIEDPTKLLGFCSVKLKLALLGCIVSVISEFELNLLAF
jgi:hypothetical protein